MRRTSALAFALAVLLARAAQAQDFPPFPPEREKHSDEDDQTALWFRDPNAGYGPFHYVSLSLFPSLRSGFETHFPDSLAAGGFELRVNESWVKNFSSTDRWLVDFELLRSNIGFSWGLSDSLRLDLAIESAGRTGGTLDAFILGFHQSFGLAVGRRDHFARNENRIEIQPPGGGARIVVDKNDPQPYEQAALVTLQDTVSPGDENLPELCWSISIRGDLATGDLARSGPLDLGGSLGIVKAYENVHLYLGGNFAWFGSEEFFGLKLRPLQWSGIVALEWNLAPEVSLIAQYQITSGGVDRLQDFSKPSHEIVAGFKWEPRRGLLVELGIVENIINFYNSPDFGIHAGLSFRW